MPVSFEKVMWFVFRRYRLTPNDTGLVAVGRTTIFYLFSFFQNRMKYCTAE